MGDHPVEQFRAWLEELTDYPTGVVPVPGYLQGTAFFSAAAGLWVEDKAAGLPAFPFGGVMFVGHNLDAEGPYRRRLASGNAHGDLPDPMMTWRNLYKLLAAAHLDRSDCFFTNVYVGLKEGDDPQGAFPGRSSPRFTRWCEQFLLRQIEVMRPRAILALGSEARRSLAGTLRISGWAPSLAPAMRVERGWAAGSMVGAAALVHPSAHHTGLHRRSYQGLTKLAAEARLVEEACAAG